ncbi:hypothetical protein CI102_159 [Trichoderma harzianum]|nr:hypothetical protein CI102_159 [Trichoderma harzianum]
MRLRSWRPPWDYLPAEIRIMILEKLASQKYPGWASLASVCREWQCVLEKLNFHKISLQVSCLDDFALLSPQTRKLVHHIYFRVELPRYSYRCCCKHRSRLTDVSPIVTDAISKLFSILSSWEPAGNLALELNAYSPSDCEHWFKNIHLSSDNVDHEGDATPTAGTGTLGSDPQHGWFDGQPFQPPQRHAIQRLFKPINLKLRVSSPKVEAVTRLIIRRQLRRCIDVKSFACMFRKLNHLEQISYEPWKPWDGWRISENQDTVNTLVIFEDSYRFYNRFPPRWPSWLQSFLQSTDPGEEIDAGFVSKSLQLQHLSISFMVNAEAFFQKCQSDWTWPRLQSLALTSKLLRHEAEHRDPITNLLLRAGVLAQQMPMIHTFVLWNCEKAHACAFIYRVERGTASITWRGTWKLKLRSRVVKAWQVVASKRRMHRSELQVKQDDIKAAINCPGDAIYHLKLPCQVIEPASLWQIRREGHTIWW